MYSFFSSLKRERASREERPPLADARAFEEDMVAEVPAAARRWLLHAIRPGTPLAASAEIDTSGELRPSPDTGWFQIKARQDLAPPLRSRWSASARSGFGWYRAEENFQLGGAELSFRLFGLFPVLTRSGPDYSRSVAELLLMQSTWIPATLLPQRGVTWEDAGPDQARAILGRGERKSVLRLTVGADGTLREVFMERWGQKPDGKWEALPFRILVEDETPFAGFVIPSVIRAGWGDGANLDETMRLAVEAIHYR